MSARPPNIKRVSLLVLLLILCPGLIFFRKRFLMGLYKGGAYIRGGGAYTWTIFCVSVIVINKYSNSDKQVLSIVIIVINSGNSDKQVGLYSGGLIFGWAYIWNEVSVSRCGGLIHGWAFIRGGVIVGGLRYIVNTSRKVYSMTE